MIKMDDKRLKVLNERENRSGLLKDDSLNEIKLDFDHISKRTMTSILNNRYWMLKELGLKVKRLELYKTTHGWHVLVTVNKGLSAYWEVCLLQMLLGSDFKREFFNYRRIKSGLKRWNVLFNRKYDSNGKLVSSERRIMKHCIKL